jgi:NADH-quinone oxidoreductase subunit L
MTRQVALVFFGSNRAEKHSHGDHAVHEPHESPAVMTWPLIVLAVCAVGLSVIGTPAWPWFQSFLGQHHEGGFTNEVIVLMVLSSVIVFTGLGVGWWLYCRKSMANADEPDVLEKLPLGMYEWFAKKYGIDELYELTVVRFNAWAARASAFLDDLVWGTAVAFVSYLAIGIGWLNDAFDRYVINLGFDRTCDGVSRSGKLMARLQDGRVQNYLRIIGVALAALVLFLIWGGGK